MPEEGAAEQQGANAEQGTPPARTAPSNRAFAAMRRENSELKTQLDAVRQEGQHTNERLNNLVSALNSVAGGGSTKADTSTPTRPDPVTATDDFVEDLDQREGRVKQDAVTAAKNTAEQTVDSRFQQNLRTELTVQAEQDFFKS